MAIACWPMAQVMLEDWRILDPQVMQVAGGAALYGVSGAGGNACDHAPFVLYLPEGAPARLDGPIDTCSPLDMDDDRRWPALDQPEHPRPDDGDMGLDARSGHYRKHARCVCTRRRAWLGARCPTLDQGHPADAVRLEPVYDVLIAGLGAEWDDFATPIGGLGSAGLIGSDYFGEACTKEVCDAEFAGIWLDARAPRGVCLLENRRQRRDPNLSRGSQPLAARRAGRTGRREQ